jgi:O-antigen ligase
LTEAAYHRYYQLALGLFAGLFFVAPKLVGLGVVLLILVLLLGAVLKHLVFRFRPMFLLPVALYLAYLTGILFTNHPVLANGYAESKLSFLIFPVIFSFVPKNGIQLRGSIIGAAIGIVITGIIGILNSMEVFRSGGGLISSFLSVNISPLHHPSYFATSILVITFGLWYFYKEKESWISLKWLVPFTLFATVIFILCLSLAAMLFLTLVFIVLILSFIRSRWGKVPFIAVLVMAPLLVWGLLSFLPGIRDEVNNTKVSVGKFLKSPEGFVIGKPGDKTGNEVRLVMWTVTCYEIMDHPFGVGTGNVDEHLSERLEHYGQKDLAKQDENGGIRYNPHNQFLQTALEIGVPGMLLLIAFIVGTLWIAHSRKDPFFQVLVYSLLINSLFESMLQRQSGIIFYSFWICLMVVYSFNQSKTAERS